LILSYTLVSKLLMLLELFITALSSGSVASLLTWLFSKKRRDNDFLSALQNSINILTENYTITLNKLVEVQRQNAELIAGQLTMQSEINTLKKENSKLLEKINELTKLLKSKTQCETSPHS